MPFIHQRDERVSHFELDRIDLQQVAHRIGRFGDFGGFRRRGHHRQFGATVFFFAGHARERCRAACEREEREGGKARHESEGGEHTRGHPPGARVGAQLTAKHHANAIGAGGAGHHETGGGADNERRHLRHESVADGENGVGAGSLRDVHVALHYANEDATENVDDDHHNAEDGIALHVLGRAVHGPVEVGRARDFLAARACFFFVDQSGRQVGVDGHLLAAPHPW